MAAVMIGVDPHKGSHTAVAISSAEEPLGELRVRACAAHVQPKLGARVWLLASGDTSKNDHARDASTQDQTRLSGIASIRHRHPGLPAPAAP
jgi:hypothetical protein